MTPSDLRDLYRGYIDCLNHQDWSNLGTFIDESGYYNGKLIGLSGYRAMLEKDFREIPDLQFNISVLIAEPPHIASRLDFVCTPASRFMGLDTGGRRISFSENVFYEFSGKKIATVWSVIDKQAIEAQL